MRTDLSLGLLVVVLACAPSTSPITAGAIEDFCVEARTILGRDDLGDLPERMHQQMDDLIKTAEQLPVTTFEALSKAVAPLIAELTLAEQGQAISGWSNATVVEHVASLCGEEGLLTWYVQP